MPKVAPSIATHTPVAAAVALALASARPAPGAHAAPLRPPPPIFRPQDFFYIYGGEQLLEEVDELCNECAQLCNKSRARLEGVQMYIMVTYLHYNLWSLLSTQGRRMWSAAGAMRLQPVPARTACRWALSSQLATQCFAPYIYHM